MKTASTITSTIFNKPHQEIDRDKYERDLRECQRKHLEGIKIGRKTNWRPCLHNGCTSCFGTGRKADGSICIHMLSCPCPKCSPSYM